MVLMQALFLPCDENREEREQHHGNSEQQGEDRERGEQPAATRAAASA
jgi:hypothetical protein